MSRPGILIVSASTGTGHLRAAEALREAATEAHPEVRVRHVDLLETAPGWVRSVYGAGYELMAARAQRTWKEIYRLTDGDGGDHARWAPLAGRLLFREFARILASGPWSACVCTHFLPSQVAARHPGAPEVSLVMTDFTVHRYWAQPAVRRYFVPTEAAAAELRRRVAGARVDATGIPVAISFARAPTQAAARAFLGLDERPLLLVTGGGLGIGVDEAAVAALEGAPPEVAVVAVCGRNTRAMARLQALQLPDGRLRVLGYTLEMDHWMAAADVVSGKPGGLFTSEALAMGKPLVLTRPVPGAEEGNVDAVVRESAALAGRCGAELRAIYNRAFSDPRLRLRLAENARRIGRPHAARAVIDTLVPATVGGRAA